MGVDRSRACGNSSARRARARDDGRTVERARQGAGCTPKRRVRRSRGDAHRVRGRGEGERDRGQGTGERARGREYVDQVQGQLAVFGLHYAILSLYTVDGATGDIASYEFLVRRNADWLESMLTTFEDGVTKQRRMHRNDWNDELL